MPHNNKFKYSYKTKGGKEISLPSKISSKDSVKIEKAIVYLKGSKAKTASKMAKELLEAKQARESAVVKEEALKDKIKPFAEELFDIQDSVWTRVIDTTEVIISLSKASSREGFNSDLFLEKIMKKFPKLKQQFLEIAEECKFVSDVSSRVNVKLKNEGVGDIIKSTYDKIKLQVTKFIDKIKANLDDYDRMIFELKQGLIKEIQKESQDILIDKSNKVMMLLD